MRKEAVGVGGMGAVVGMRQPLFVAGEAPGGVSLRKRGELR